MILGGTPVDLDSITKPWSGSESITDSEYYWFYNKIRRPTLSYEMKSLFWSTKSGPNGPALIYSMVDLLAIKSKPQLIKALMHFYGHKYAAFFDYWLKTINKRIPVLQDILKLKLHRKLKLRKLSVKPDRESKSRVFAILDYWSQSALKGLHEELFKLLRKLPADKTFNQGGHLAEMAAKESNHSFHSLDLSSATDRFPLITQKKLLALMTDVDTANAWEEIMINHEFHLSDPPGEYKYSTGQPMGAHSSWPLFTLSHHLVVQVAAKRAGACTHSLFNDYCLLGDDIVIHHDDVAREYKKILNTYDVPISDAKSHVSKDTFEFAKRWFHKGTEVTPYPIVGLISVSKHWALTSELIGHQAPIFGYKNSSDFGDPIWNALELVLASGKPRLGRSLSQKVRTVQSLPNWWVNCPEEELPLKVANLFQQLDVKPPTGSPAEVLDWISSHAHALVTREIVKSGNKSREQALKWRSSLYELESGTAEADQASTSLGWVRDVPPLIVIREMAVQSQTQLDLSQFSLEWRVFWSRWRNLDLMFLPRLNGILPERNRDRMSKSQAFLGLEVFKKIKSISDIQATYERWLNAREEMMFRGMFPF